MDRIKIGVICPSEIAFRRFMPALQKTKAFEYIGVAYPSAEDWNGASEANLVAEREKALRFKENYGGEVFEGYKTLICREEIEAVYLPLPPALHYQWAELALKYGKHVFVEKPSTTESEHTCKLIELAKEKNLALHENYMFQYHQQIEEIQKLIQSGRIGEVRLIRGNFGFPKRAANDFRYNKALGGGALLDCGGYPIRLISTLLGDTVKVDAAKLFYTDNGIDLYGSVQLSTEKQVAQISFGMDNFYKCDIEVWGSTGIITTNRVFTAPEGFAVDIKVVTNNNEDVVHVEGDDSFLKSIVRFEKCIKDQMIRENEYKELANQIELVEHVRKQGGNEL